MADFRRFVAWPGAPLGIASAALFGASTPLAKALLIALDEAEERDQIRGERLQSLDDYPDEEPVEDDFDDEY